MQDGDSFAGGTYPEPPEEETKYVSGTIYIRYDFKDVEVPKKWEDEQIKEDIYENISDYIYSSREIIEEIEVD